MKRIFVFAAAFFAISFAEGQRLRQSEVPVIVRQAFSKLFPKAKEVKWSREKSDEFEAEFKKDGRKMSLNFDTRGNLRGTEMEIAKGDLPKAVQDAISKQFAGYKIFKVEKSDIPGKSEVFETELKSGSFVWEVTFAANGTILAKEEKHNND